MMFLYALTVVCVALGLVSQIRSDFFHCRGSCPVMYILCTSGSSNGDISDEKSLRKSGGIWSGVVAVDVLVVVNCFCMSWMLGSR